MISLRELVGPSIAPLCWSTPDYVLKLFYALDEARAPQSIMAKDKDVKGNGWARALDILFCEDRGTLAGYVPKIDKPTQLKKRVIELWKWIKNNQSHPQLDPDVSKHALKQLKCHEKAVTDNASAVATAKETNAVLDQQMVNYERGKGALPPGAKGEQGKGRVQHSTNLNIGNPAMFSFAHYQIGKDSSAAEAENTTLKNHVEGEDGLEWETPKRKKARKEKSPPSASTNKFQCFDGNKADEWCLRECNLTAKFRVKQCTQRGSIEGFHHSGKAQITETESYGNDTLLERGKCR
jgi:hypothetical protein